MTRNESSESGQAVVEFSLSILVFIVMLMGVFDLGRGIYMYNGVSEAAREIARATSVDSAIALGAGTKAVSTVAVQRGLIPDMNTPTFQCVDIAGNSSASSPCQSGEYVRVTVTATYRPVSLLGLPGPITVSSTSSAQIP